MFNTRFLLLLNLTALSLFSSTSFADGNPVDKVYAPYVQPLEREIEWRMTDSDGRQIQRLGVGKSVNDRLFIEAYLIAQDNQHNDLRLEAIELEALWQLTEQGEYAVDWGLITELERQRDENNWDVATGLIALKEWGKWVGTANFWLKYEWGESVQSEFETALALQTRYRLSRFFEPAVEFYAGEDTRALGPVFLGDISLSPGKKLHWELGVLTGLNAKTADVNWRALVEYEF